MTKVSVIVPVYNTEKYIRRCLNSVLEQTLRDIEIICVDDGSTDASPQILDEYAARDSRIRVIHKENGGLVSARKAGVAASSGEYVGYVDSDDWIEPEMYERLYDIAIGDSAEKSDMVTSGYFLEGNYTTCHMDTVEAGVYGEEKIDNLRENVIYCMSKKETGLRATLCSKLFLREKFAAVQASVPDKLTMAEDKMCLLAYILECKYVVVLKEAYYHYMINMESIVHTENPEYLLDVDGVYRFLLTLYPHPDFTENMRVQSELYVMELLLKGMNTLLGFHTRNLLWFDPYWLDRLPEDSRIVLYGAGEAGQKYRKQLSSRNDLHFAGCVDFGYERFHDDVLQVRSPEILKTLEFDYIVITIKNHDKAEQVRCQMEEMGIQRDKILWFEQRELFWKYAEAEGLLKAAQKPCQAKRIT